MYLFLQEMETTFLSVCFGALNSNPQRKWPSCQVFKKNRVEYQYTKLNVCKIIYSKLKVKN